MPEIVVRHIDEATAERIKTLARERDWSINEVILHALHFGLGLGGESAATHDDRDDPHDVARLAGTWDDSESRAFEDAVSALDEAPEGFFARLPSTDSED